MPDSPKKFYLTTPIYYVNARPHIGHAYTTVVADVIARRHRLLGDDTFFLTGTDEHGQKIERSAIAAGIPPQQFADQVSQTFQDLWKRMGITHDAFIRTSDPRHKQGVQHLFQTLRDRGYIYLSTYTGQYCVSDEAYVDGPPGIRCPDCGRTTETVSESNYYFRLSAFQLPLLNLIEPGPNGEPAQLHITPESRRNEVLSFLRGPFNDTLEKIAADPDSHKDSPQAPKALSKVDAAATAGGPTWHLNYERHAESGMSYVPGALKDLSLSGKSYLPGALKDLSISRTSFKWGIPVPGDEAHVIYVWLDALANYMTAIGYGSDNPEDIATFERYWPADLHLVGKEIIRFHCVYWPAFLLALNPQLQHAPNEPAPELSLETQQAWIDRMLPKAITAHGWLLFDDSKMSKSKGNIVRTETILDAFGDHYRTSIAAHNQKLAANPAPNSASLKGTASAVPHLATSSTGQAASPKGTASAVPSPTTADTALAAEVRSPSKRDQDLFASDVLRYFLLREIPFGQDGSFSFDALITRYNADLANGYGNLVSRTLSMMHKYLDAVVPESVEAPPGSGTIGVPVGGKARTPIEQAIASTVMLEGAIGAAIELYDFSFALGLVGTAITVADQMLSVEKPWKLDQDTSEGKHRTSVILYTAAESIRIITALLYPILPYSTAKVWAQLGLGDIEQAAKNGDLKDLSWGGLKPGTKLGPLSPIFPRAPKELAQTMADIESTPKDLTSIPDAAPDSPYPAAPTSKAAPPASRLSNETTTAASPVPASSFAPNAGPRTGSLPATNPIAQVAGSTATTTERPKPPSHTEASPSGLFKTPASTQPITATTPKEGPGFSRTAISPAEGGSALPKAVLPNPATDLQATPQITIDDFAKVELRVAKILVCERIPKADKLLRLEVDLGTEHRQILSGIAEWYTPEDLIGRKIVVITNLAPRKMRGLESHGMLLAASTGDNGKPALATFSEADNIEVGARLK